MRLKGAGQSWSHMKHKANRKPGGMDNCSTPPYAVEPLLHYIPNNSLIYESASGEGYIINYLINYFRIIYGDILININYFEREIINYDVEITNPPFSLKYLWLADAYSRNKPFCLLLPVETIGSGTAQKLFDNYGIQVIYMSPRVDFRMPNKKWVWLDDNGKIRHSSSQFPTAWFCWKMNLPKDIMFADISMGKRKWRAEKEQEFRTSVLLQK